MTSSDLAPGPNPTYTCYKDKSATTASSPADLALPEKPTKFRFAYPGKT